MILPNIFQDICFLIFDTFVNFYVIIIFKDMLASSTVFKTWFSLSYLGQSLVLLLVNFQQIHKCNLYMKEYLSKLLASLEQVYLYCLANMKDLPSY